MVNDLVMRQLGKNQTKLSILQEQLSSGKALSRPSDNPIEVGNDLDLRASLAHRAQNGRNNDNGSTYLTVLDSTMMGFDDLFQRTRELALQGASDTLLARDRQSVNDEVRQVLLQMVNLGNSSYKGDYLFSGTDTDKAPYSVLQGGMNINLVGNEVPLGGVIPDPTDPTYALNVPLKLYDRNIEDSIDPVSPYGNPAVRRIIPGTLEINNLVEGTDFTVDYVKGEITFLTPAADAEATAGTLDINFDWIRRNELLNTNGDIKREIEPGIVMNINVKADDVFGDELSMDTYSSVISLMQGLHTNTQSEIETSITNVDDSLIRMLGQQATVGAWSNRMTATIGRNDENIIIATDLQSKIEDLDFAEAISQFTMADSVYQASLKSASKVLTNTLMDYL
jgi:flagellar hook-associated protein 3 FlgL